MHKIATYLSFLVRPFRWRGLCPLKILLARHHFSRKKKPNKKHPKRCYRTCAHPPTVCLLWLLFTVSKVSICRRFFKLPFLFICALVFRDFPCVSFSLFKQKGCSCPFYLVHCWLFPTVDALKLFTSAVFSGWTMRCCILFSVSIFLVVVLSCNVKQQS